MRLCIAIAAVSGMACVTACERDPGVVAPPAPIAVPPAPIAANQAPAMTLPAPPPPPATPPTPPAQDPNLPKPIDPAEYAAWLGAQTPAEQHRIAADCRRDPTAFSKRCGGIGPLHIPYPPYMRARAPQPTDEKKSPYASVEQWEAALTPAQHAYIKKYCHGGEDQPTSDLCGDNTPLVVSFDDAPVQLARGDAAATFAFAPGAPVASDWPSASTPWIALDRDGDGAITSGAELFGNHSGGDRFANGFVALAALDANHDGVIDARDPAFAQLVLWSDRDGDRKSSPAELQPLAQRIVSISLDASAAAARCDARGNCEGERAALTWRDADGALHRGAVIDVYLPTR